MLHAFELANLSTNSVGDSFLMGVSSVAGASQLNGKHSRCNNDFRYLLVEARISLIGGDSLCIFVVKLSGYVDSLL